MPRRQPFSNKQKKAQLHNKRAEKRGEAEDEGGAAGGRKKKAAAQARRPGVSRSENAGPRLALESRFVAIPRQYLEKTRDTAYAYPLPRPLPDEAAAFPLHLVANPAGAPLCVPARPRFRYGQTKKEVEKNEEGVFRKWLAGTRAVVEEWVEQGRWDAAGGKEGEEGEEGGNHGLEWIHSPSWFETNLEVWRQLWRVVEQSSILLLLIDARCVPVHCPPSLRTYLRNLKPRRQIILVLTKADLVDPSAVDGWKAWLREWWALGAAEDAVPRRSGKGAGSRAGPPADKPAQATPPESDGADDIQIVSVSSYDTALLYGPGRTRHRPEIPESARAKLVDALRIAHERILSPPAWAASDTEKLAAWKPPVRREVHWDELEELDVNAGIKWIGKKGRAEKAEREAAKAAGGENDDEDYGSDSKKAYEDGADDDSPPERDPQSEPLTIGLVGQPNVGKSSLLNALLGTTRVRASKTPGKTKHFQTIFWGARREIKIVDCPGLVCPSLVPMELQAMAGILPISQIPSLPSCIHFAARVMPLEDIFHVPSPEVEVDDMEAKKSWREPREHTTATTKIPTWTAGGIMEARALDRGFVLRTLADGRVRWGFWPPGTRPVRDGRGVWLGAYEGDIDAEHAGGSKYGDSFSDSGSEDEDEDADNGDQTGSEDQTGGSAAVSDNEETGQSESESEAEDAFTTANNRSFFAALDMNDDEDEEEDEDEDDSDHDRVGAGQ